MLRLACVFGTRPEAIKMAPVIAVARKTPEVSIRVIVTALHLEMLDQVLRVFNIVPDLDLNLMIPSQSRELLTAGAIAPLARALEKVKPDVVPVQGDTTTAFVASLVAFFRCTTFVVVKVIYRSADLARSQSQDKASCQSP